MKHPLQLLLYLMSLLYMSFVPLQSPPPFSLVGTWEGGSADKKGRLVFRENGELEMHAQGQAPLKTNEEGRVTYVFDNTKSPAWLDIVIVPLAPPDTETMQRMQLPTEIRMLGIVEIISADEIKLQLASEMVTQDRPNSFESVRNAVIFRRVRK